MWSRLGALLQQAVESREPAQDLLQSFVQHWRGVTQYYLETTDESRNARDTDIPWRLRQLLDILVYEERELKNGENGDPAGVGDPAGPCMEYLLQHKILETLCTLAKAEYPPGMRQQVLLFYSRLLTKVQRPLLHYLSVHRPVQKLISLAGQPGVTDRKEELQFLSAVCAKLEKDPSLLIHVLEAEAGGRSGGAEQEDEGSSAAPKRKPRQNLFKALLRLCNCRSQKGKLAVKAREALLAVLRAAQEEGPVNLIARSDLSTLVAEHLCELSACIPATTHPYDITIQEDTGWRTELGTEDKDNIGEHAALRRFFCWVEYCDWLVRESHEVIGTAISRSVAEKYLLGVLQPELLEVSELSILRSTALLTALFQHLAASPLLQQLLSFVLGEDTDPEKRNDRRPPLRAQLIQRCNHLSDEISLASLRLFEVILQLPSEIALHNLVTRNLETRGYLSGAQDESKGLDGDAWEGTEELEEDPYFTEGFSDNELRLTERNPKQRAEPAGREQSVRSFLSLVPEEMKSSDSGYDSYLQDALVQYQVLCKVTSRWKWPLTPHPLLAGHQGQEFYEGHFLEVLFDRLGGILDQPYEMNLLATSLLGRLALFPHPHLQEYLLDPFISLAPGARSLFSVLVRVVADLAQRSLRVSRFQETLCLVKRQLLGDSPDVQLSHTTLCRGVVVLEEFCKELAAAACVTHHPLPN
ncbi:FHF complex subunit HOOK interacting protein 2B [Spea bombifrons]|uniref:FHF complex subunit HOOK interacting protein 2B n=1 Tax=Spea bombifrons TaxID=233779 RepID=UPI00234B5C51|nr:FHF complex subunit HOOK interacting protein 2B [Spea bombifrons]